MPETMATPSQPLASSLDSTEGEDVWDLSQTQRRPSQSITEVLQNPHALRLHLDLAPPIPTTSLARDALRRRRSSSLAHTVSPQYSINDFEAYLRLTTDRYDQYLALASYSKAQQYHPSTTADALDPPTASRPHHQLPLQTSIPPEFFQKHFNVAMYSLVSSLSDLSTNSDQVAVLRRDLASYSTSVESAIFIAVRARSNEIAKAVAALDALRSASKVTTQVTHKLRTSTLQAATEVRQGAIQVGNVYLRKNNLSRLLSTTELLVRALRDADDLETLVQAGEYSAAMDLMDATTIAVEDESLIGLHALDLVAKKMSAAKDAIEIGLRDTFHSLVIELRATEYDDTALHPSESLGFDLIANVSSTNHIRAIQNSPLLSTDGPIPLVISAVVRLGRIASLTQFFLDEINDLVDGVVASVLVKTRSTERAAFDGLLAICSTVVGADTINNLFTTKMKDNDPQMPRLREILDAFSTRIDDRCTEMVTHLLKDPLPYVRDAIAGIIRFGDVIRTTLEVANQLSLHLPTKSNRMRSLYATAGERTRALVLALHRQQMDSLSKLLAREKWAEVRVPTEVQAWVDQLRSVASIQERISSLDDDPFLKSSGLLHDKESSGSGLLSATLPPPTHFWKIPEELSNQGREQDAEVLMIVSESFKMVPTGLVVLKAVVLYVVCATELGGMTAIGGEIVRRCCEYLRSFNETSSRLVLGAGAMRTAGLKSITARHLALSSRVIGACLAVSRLVGGATKGYLPKAQAQIASDQLARVTTDMADHELQLLSKIRGVMLDRLDHHRRSYESCKWESEKEMRSFDIPTQAVGSLIKETSVLHRILLSLLPRVSLAALFGDIGAVYGDKLTETFNRVAGLSPDAKWVRIRLAADVGFVHLKLRGMEAFGRMPPIDALLEKYGELPKKAKPEIEEMAPPGDMDIFAEPNTGEQVKTQGTPSGEGGMARPVLDEKDEEANSSGEPDGCENRPRPVSVLKPSQVEATANDSAEKTKDSEEMNSFAHQNTGEQVRTQGTASGEGGVAGPVLDEKGKEANTSGSSDEPDGCENKPRPVSVLKPSQVEATATDSAEKTMDSEEMNSMSGTVEQTENGEDERPTPESVT